MRRPPIALLALLLVALLAGCGQSRTNFEDPSGNAESSGETIAVADADQVFEAEESAETYCGLIKNQEGSMMPLPTAISILVRVLRQQPMGVVNTGNSTSSRNMTTVVSDVATRLETCPRPNRQAAQVLRQALARYGSDVKGRT